MALGRLLRIFCVVLLPSAAQAGGQDDWAKALRALGAGDARPLAALAERKAEKGDVNAQHLLSGLHLDGIGTSRDAAKFESWLKKAAEGGNPAALAALCGGRDAAVTDSRACERAAALGVPSAQTKVAVAWLARQAGAPTDPGEPVRLLEKAAEAQDAWAETLLGILLHEGRGVQPDERRAIELWRRAARQGDATALRLLAQAHFEGRGAARDVAEGLRLMQQAAGRGDARAQLLLGVAYASGADVRPDPARAYVWLGLAERGLDGAAKDEAGHRREALAKLLGDRERREAEAAVAAFRPEPAPRRPLDPGRPYVERLQQRLKAAGVDPGATGRLDERTLAAIESLFARYGIRQARIDPVALAGAALEVWQSDTHAPEPLKPATYGTGFFVSAQGHLITSLHVVENCTAVRAEGLGIIQEVLRDDAADLVLLRAQATPAAVAVFRAAPEARQGESIYVFGYPLRRILASEPIITQGIVNALAGVGDDQRQLQISAEVQPGNSGGPVLDRSGLVIGVVASRMRDDLVMQGLGIIPQNINFAMKLGNVLKLLRKAGLGAGMAQAGAPIASEEIAERAGAFTVPIECLR